MLEQANGLLLDELCDHVAENSAHCIESLVCGANVAQSNVIKKDFLYNENCDSLTQLRSSLHDTKTKRDDLGCEEEVDHIGRVILHQCADNTQRR